MTDATDFTPELRDYLSRIRDYSIRKGWMNSRLRRTVIRTVLYSVAVSWIVAALYSTTASGEIAERITDVAVWTLNAFFVLLTLVYVMMVVGASGMSRDSNELLSGGYVEGVTKVSANKNLLMTDNLFLASNNALINAKLFRYGDLLTLALLVSLVYAGWFVTALVVLICVILLKVTGLIGSNVAEKRALSLMGGSGVYADIPEE